jgi:hypothetical protein
VGVVRLRGMSEDVISGRVPTAEDEARFWALLEDAWSRADPEARAARARLAEGRGGDEYADAATVESVLDSVLDDVARSCAEFTGDELTALDRVAERRLWDLDREDVHDATDGSDDGFLYCRGFVVALGQAYFEAVDADPGYAVMDAECERMCYFFAHLHRDRFADYPDTRSGISRESCSRAWT